MWKCEEQKESVGKVEIILVRHDLKAMDQPDQVARFLSWQHFQF